MWKKEILALVLALQYANALHCYSCDSPQSCNNPSIQSCNDATANATSDWLNSIHRDVPIIRGSSKYRCVNLTYYLNGNTVKTHEFLGCYHPGISVCYLTLNISHSSNWGKKCTTCDWNYCNRNPAGSFSSSTYTIIASVMGIFLAKLWN